MKRYISFFLVLFSFVLIMPRSISCKQAPQGTMNRKAPLVAIITPFSHPSLNQSIQGFKSGLTLKGYGKSKIDYLDMNATGDFSKISLIVESAIKKKPALIFVLTSPAASFAVKLTDKAKIPLVYCAVTDPIGANIVTSMEHSKTNATGISDRFPVKEQVKIFNILSRNMKSVGIIYNPKEQNSRVLVGQTIDAFKEYNIPVIKYTINKADEISSKTKLALGENSCIVVNGDNLATENLATIINLCKKEKKPLFVGDPDSVRKGGVATVGPSYYHLGVRAGYKAAKILQGEKANDIPSEYPHEFDYIINMDSAAKMGVKVPIEFWELRTIWESRDQPYTR